MLDIGIKKRTSEREKLKQALNLLTTIENSIKIAFVLLICLSTTTSYGQTDLKSLINYSLKHSHDIKKSDLQYKEATYQQKEAIGKGLPQIEGKADYSKMFISIDLPESMYQMVGPDYAPLLDQIANMDAIYMSSIGAQVTQLIYSQSYIEGLKTVKKTKELYQTLKAKTEEEVIEEVANNYYQLLALYLQLETVDKSLVNLDKMYQIVNLSYENDLIVKTDVNRLKVNITNLEVTKQTLQNSIDLQLNYTKALAGMPSDTILKVDTAFIARNLELRQHGFNAFSAEQVPAFQALLKQDDIYKQQVKLAQAEYYPTIAAYGQMNYSSYNTEAKIEKMRNMSTIGVQLKIPIFTSGVNHAKVQQKRVRELGLQEDILKNEKLLNINYQNAMMEYQSAHDLLAVQEENKKLAQDVYNQMSLQFKEGVASMADLLNVNSDFLQADNSYNQQLLKCKLSEIKVLKATGTLKQLANNK